MNTSDDQNASKLDARFLKLVGAMTLVGLAVAMIIAPAWMLIAESSTDPTLRGSWFAPDADAVTVLLFGVAAIATAMFAVGPTVIGAWFMTHWLIGGRPVSIITIIGLGCALALLLWAALVRDFSMMPLMLVCASAQALGMWWTGRRLMR